MDRSKLEKIITHFQARARGYLLRNEVQRAREDFEEIVTEIEGSLTHLKWTETVISVPHFTDIGDSYLHPGISSIKPSEPRLDDNIIHERSASTSEKTGDICGLVERKEAERDVSHGCERSSAVSWDGEEQKGSTKGNKDGEVMGSTSRSSTTWSSLEFEIKSYSHEGKCCTVQEVPHTPEALRRHRNTLTMELLWLQQAIDSRKKYLSLKDRLSIA